MQPFSGVVCFDDGRYFILNTSAGICAFILSSWRSREDSGVGEEPTPHPLQYRLVLYNSDSVFPIRVKCCVGMQKNVSVRTCVRACVRVCVCVYARTQAGARVCACAWVGVCDCVCLCHCVSVQITLLP